MRNRINVFERFIKGEMRTHMDVVEYLNYKYPHVMYHHSPNEGKRTPFEQFILSRSGVSKGYPDFILYSNDLAIALELKHERNMPTPSQVKWLQYFNEHHWGGYVAWTFDAAIKIIDSFYNQQSLLSDLLGVDGYLVLAGDTLPPKIKKHI